MKTPLFSVVIPALNEEKFLPSLLESLTTQTLKDFEVIVVDGSSKDKTVEVTNSFKKWLPKLNVIVSKKASLPLQRNLGARAAVGQWLVFIDADSVLLPYALERMEEFIRKNNTQFFTAWFRPDSEVAGDSLLILFANLLLEAGIRFRRPLAPGPLTVVKKTVYESVGGYNEDHAFNEDYEFSMRVAKSGVPLAILRETLYVLSLRRLRQQGTLKVLQQYALATLPMLFFRRTLKNFPGYTMGGQLYAKKRRPIKRSVLREYEMKLKKLMRELFD